MAMGDPGTGAPASEEILVIRLSDGETVSHYTEGFNKPAMYDELAGDLAAMTAEEFEAEWVH